MKIYRFALLAVVARLPGTNMAVADALDHRKADLAAANGVLETTTTAATTTSTMRRAKTLKKEAEDRPLNVGFLSAISEVRNLDVLEKLDSTGIDLNVTLVNVNAETPELSDLEQFDSVLVSSDDSFENSAALGDVLADYVDDGRGVVTTVFTIGDNVGGEASLLGRWLDDGYGCIPSVPTGNKQDGQYFLDTTGPDYDAGSPLLKDVSSFDGGANDNNIRAGSYRSPADTVAENCTIHARWTDDIGSIFLASTTKFEGCRVDLNFYPPSSDVRPVFWNSTTDGGQLMANALVYAATCNEQQTAKSAKKTKTTKGTKVPERL